MLEIGHLCGKKSDDPVPLLFPAQTISRMLAPARFEFGFHRRDLRPFTYAAGDIILSRRMGEKWVRWDESVMMLSLNIGDEAFRHVTGNPGEVPWLAGEGRLDDARVHALFAAVQAEQAAGFVSGAIFLDSVAIALASIFISRYGFSPRRARQHRDGLAPDQLRRVTELVNDNLDKNLRLQQLAEYAKLSPAYFSQQFHRSTGLAPHQFILKARAEKARSLLIQRRERILDIALTCGFRSQQHFSHVFRKFYGQSPAEYRTNR